MLLRHYSLVCEIHNSVQYLLCNVANIFYLYSTSMGSKVWPIMSYSDWENLQAGSYVQNEVGPKVTKKKVKYAFKEP